jgi:1,4-alpha-glucan branching enzyme
MLPIEISPKNVRVGANRLPDGGWEFVLWARNAREVSIVLPGRRGGPFTMESLGNGYYRAAVKDLEPGSQYLYRLEDARDLPDPASRYQPQGVHGP